MASEGTLRCILLIDDDEATNFLQGIIVEEWGRAERVVVVDSGQKAIDFLTTQEQDRYPQPDLITVDVNMPGMSGWEFLKEYDALPNNQQGAVVMVMLTTSLNPDDLARVENMGVVKGFLNKPLTVEMLNEVMTQHFANNT